MALSKSIFEQLSDRIGVQVRTVASGLDAAASPGGTSRYKMIHSGIGTNGDYVSENALIAPAYTMDQGTTFSRSTHINTCFSNVITADANYARTLGFTDLNGYLWQSGINAGSDYDLAYYYSTGSHLNAVNVFGPVVAPVATVVFASSGVAAFSAGTAVGTGTGVVSNTNHAAANVEVVIQSGLSATPVHLDIFAKIEGATSGTTENRTLTIDLAGTESTGERYLVGTLGNKGDMVLSVTDVIAAGGDTGDAVTIESVLERTIHI